VDRWDVYVGQQALGSVNDRLDGIFWANAFGTAYIEAIGENVLMSVPWSRVERTPNGLIAWLYDDPGELPADLIERRHEARRIWARKSSWPGAWSGCR
jgi:hypothetical protein